MVFGRLRANGSAGWGLLIVAAAMSAIVVITSAPTVGDQFRVLIDMVVMLVVMAYIAAGLSLLLGAPGMPSGTRERLLGMGALAACGLLVYSSPVKTLVGALIVALLAWAAWRGFGRGARRA